MRRRRKFSTTVYLEAVQVDQLKMLSERTGVPVAEYVRQGIDLFLDMPRAPMGAQVFAPARAKQDKA